MGSSPPTHIPTRCVLVAVDFSAEADAAVDLGATLAEGMGLPLTLLHVVHDPSHAPGFYNLSERLGDKARKHEKRWEKRARTMVGAAEEMLSAYLARRREAEPERAILSEAEVALVAGTPANRIVEVAHERDARMIVMGSRGRGALSGILLGSTAHRVVHLSRVPVTLVKADPPEPAKRDARKEESA